MRINPKKCIAKHNVIKLSKNKGKEKILKSVREATSDI